MSARVEVLHLCLQIALGIALPARIIGHDMARSSGERLARAWNDASRWSAIVAFGPLALIVHFTRTRRSWLGLLLGLGWAAVAVAASALLEALFPG